MVHKLGSKLVSKLVLKLVAKLVGKLIPTQIREMFFKLVSNWF